MTPRAMVSSATPVAVAGLTVTKRVDQWWVTHTASRLPLHQHGFLARAEAAAAVGELAGLGIDWSQDAPAIRAAVDHSPGGRAEVEQILTSPEQRERQRRLTANSTRHLRALEAAGEHVVERTSYGLGGTVYRMSCGCHRSYSLDLLGLSSQEPKEDLPVRCEKHRDLAVAAETTEVTAIRRELHTRPTEAGPALTGRVDETRLDGRSR
jgi:hypothetical protein